MHPHIPLSEFQSEVLCGSLLGDGHLALQKGAANARLIISRSIKDRLYLQYEADIFKNLLAPSYKNEVKYCSSLNKRTKLLQESYTFSTINNSSLTEYHNVWYKKLNNKFIKIVPDNLKLSPVAIAHWIADDGHITYNKLPYRFKLELSTHGFSCEDVTKLAKLLSIRYNEEFLVKQKNRGSKKYFIIIAYDSACREVFKDIDSSFKMVRKRIWDNPESRFYNNVPDRQKKISYIFSFRESIVEQKIADGKDFKLQDLAKQLNYIYNNKIDYKSVNKLLSKYICSGKIIKYYDIHNNNTCMIRILK